MNWSHPLSVINVLRRSNFAPLFRCVVVCTVHQSYISSLPPQLALHTDKSGIASLFGATEAKSANISLNLFRFAPKNATISILQTSCILRPAALLHNSHSLGKVCIAEAGKKGEKKKINRRKEKKSLHVKFRDVTAPITVVL